MKKLSILVLFLAVFGNVHNLFSWDTTAAKYFPLAVGNQWSYHKINRIGFNCIQFSTESDYIVTVVSDTLMPNGKRYFRIQGPALTFERIDSATMNVYKFDMGSECITDSLLARINNNFNSCGEGYSPNQYRVLDTNNITFFNSSRKTKTILGNSLIGHQYTLMYGMGLYRKSVCEISGAIVSLNGCIINGIQYGVLLGVENPGAIIPNSYSLSQNYPNPFNPTTKIRFSIPQNETSQRDVSTKLVIYDALGRELQTLVNEELLPGTYEADFDGSNLPSGVYFYELVSGDFIQTKKMVLIK